MLHGREGGGGREAQVTDGTKPGQGDGPGGRVAHGEGERDGYVWQSAEAQWQSGGREAGGRVQASCGGEGERERQRETMAAWGRKEQRETIRCVHVHVQVEGYYLIAETAHGGRRNLRASWLPEEQAGQKAC